MCWGGQGGAARMLTEYCCASASSLAAASACLRRSCAVLSSCFWRRSASRLRFSASRFCRLASRACSIPQHQVSSFPPRRFCIRCTAPLSLHLQLAYCRWRAWQMESAAHGGCQPPFIQGGSVDVICTRHYLCLRRLACTARTCSAWKISYSARSLARLAAASSYSPGASLAALA